MISQNANEALASLPLEALKAARMVAWQFDPATGRVLFSENAPDVFGLLPGVTAQNVADGFAQVHPEDVAEHRAKVSEAIAHGGTYVSRYRFLRRTDGEFIWLEERGQAVTARAGVRLVGVSMDITERKHLQDRDAFLIRLDDAVRPLLHPEEVMRTAAEMLGRHLDVDRCAYADIEPDQDTMNLTGNYNRSPEIRSMVGRLKFADFGAEVLRLMRENKPYVVHDVDTHDPRPSNLAAYRTAQIQAVICVPLHKAGRFVGAMAVHSLRPRQWRPDEVEIVQLVAARCWESIERIRIARDLHLREEKYRSLFNSLDAGFCIVEILFNERDEPIDYLFLEINAAFERQTGLHDVVGKSMRSLAPEHEQHWFEIYGQVARTGEPVRFERAASALHDRWYDVFAFRVGDPAARQVAVLFQDIAERRRSELALREREAVLRTVTNAARVGLVMVDRERRYLFANQTYAEILGLPNAEIVGQRVADVLAAVYDQIKPRLDHAFTTGERVSYELRVPVHARTRDERFYEVVYEPRGYGGPEPYLVVVIIDVTQRKKTQETLEATVAERTAKLRDTIHDLEAFSYSVAHDMRAPLRSMRSFADILLSDFSQPLPAEGRDLLHRIARSAERLDELTLDVLAYSKLAVVHMPLETVDTSALLHEVVESYAHLRDRGALIRIAPDIPPVHANRSGLTQVFSNLLGNAVKFVNPGVTPEVTVRWEQSGSGIRIIVADNGIGIAEQHLSRLFGMFERIHPGEPFEGTGIGLAVAKKAAERMGGKMGVRSRLGAGSEFWIDLPLAWPKRR